MMTWQLKVLVAPPSTHMVAYNYLARQWWHMQPLGHLGGRVRCISEIETSIEPTKQQSEKAKEFLRLRDELKSIEIGLFIHNINDYNIYRKHIRNNK